MQILGIDYGRKKIGIALADTTTLLAVPYKVIRVKSVEDAVVKISQVVDELAIEKIIIGLSMYQMRNQTKIFANLLESKVVAKIEFVDENFSTKMAQKASLFANIRQSKRKMMEDAYAACIILQDYLDYKL